MEIIKFTTSNNIDNISNSNQKTCINFENTNITNEIDDSFTENDETSRFKGIVQKYDITDISRNEANKMYKELMDNNLISLKDVLVTFNPSKIPGYNSQNTFISGTKLVVNDETKINLLEQLKTQSEYNKTHGNSAFQKNFDDRVALAEKIHHFQN